MQLAITEYSGEGFTRVVTTHHDQVLEWDTRLYIKVRLKNAEEVFGGINLYLASLSDEAQGAIFECYKEIKECLDDMVDPGTMTDPIKQLVKKIYRYVPMDHLHDWMMKHYPVFMPTDAPDTVDMDNDHLSLAETYTKEDYYRLATFSLATRLMLPIWAEYIVQGGGGNTGDLYREMDAMSLVTGTEMMNWPKQEKQLSVRNKLLNYIEVKVEKADSSASKRQAKGNSFSVAMSNLRNGISITEMPVRLLAMSLIRRLTIVPLADHSQAHNIVANIHYYTQNKLNNGDQRGQRISPKRKDTDSRDEDDKTSMMEEYKTKSRVAGGDVETYENDTYRPAILARRVDPSIDIKLLSKTFEALPNMKSIIASDHQVSIAQWALSKAFPSRAFGDIDNDAVNRLLVTAQALYWHWGLFDIAVLLTVEPFQTDNMASLTTSKRSTARFTRQIQDDMMELYPYTFPQSGKDPNERKGNVGLQGISLTFQDIFSADWIYRGHPELLRLTHQPEGARVLIVSPSIKQSLADAVGKTASLNQ